MSRPPGARAEAAARLIAVTDAKIAKYDTEYPGPEPEAEPDPERDRLDADLAEIRADAEAAEKAAAPVRDRGAFAAEGDHDGSAQPGTALRINLDSTPWHGCTIVARIARDCRNPSWRHLR